jgi:hypothetical protein
LDEEQASESLLSLHNELAALQSRLNDAAGRLSRVRKTRAKVKQRKSEAIRRGLKGLEEDDGVLSALDAHERWVVSDLQSAGVPNDVDWSLFGLEGLEDATPLLEGGPSVVPEETSSGGAARG